MNDLITYVRQHVERGACQCGQCIDAPPNPEQQQPTGHTADLIFFKVCAKDNPDKEELRSAIKAHRGRYGYPLLDLFDGKEHSYLEIGGWIGDQGLAMMLMGLGSLLNLWQLLTPKTVLGSEISDDTAMRMAQSGLITIQSK